MNIDITTVKKALDLFEYQEKENRQWYSFKLDAITSKDPLYRKFSDLIMNSEVDEDSGYTWTYYALESLSEKLEDNMSLEDIEDSLGEWADAITPVYNSELVSWVAKKNNYRLVDESINELGKGETLIYDIMGAYAMNAERHYRDVISLLESL